MTQNPAVTKVRIPLPPVCDICERRVTFVSSKRILGTSDQLCRDCWHQWYDPDFGHDNTREGIKEATLNKHGRFGGEADLTEQLNVIIDEILAINRNPAL